MQQISPKSTSQQTLQLTGLRRNGEVREQVASSRSASEALVVGELAAAFQSAGVGHDLLSGDRCCQLDEDVK